MKYISTRGEAPRLAFDDVLLAGLASDGGLYVPETWPKFTKSEIRAMRGLSYGDIALRVMTPFVAGAIPEAEFAAMVGDTFAAFDHPAVAPVKQLAGDMWLAELFHGPTLAFKDYSLQLVGRLFDHVLARRSRRVTIVGATSGDTGSAAIEACRDRQSIDIFILHPKGRVSDIQRRQMTTVAAENVHNIAIEGTFDDCQDLVKELFNDQAFRVRHDLAAVNSINWARIMAQIVYYFATAVALGAPDRRFVYSVPTGNFGNVYAGYAARKMGLPVDKFIVASNDNDILTRYFETGRMKMAPVIATYSPSMDIQISSNFERLLFDYCRGNGRTVANSMARFRRDGEAEFGKGRWRAMAGLFEATRIGDDATLAAIARIYDQTGELLDPHSAIGVAAADGRQTEPGVSTIAMATAHPAKFPDAVEAATGVRPALPAGLEDLMERKENFNVLGNNAADVRDFIAAKLGERVPV